jgi:exopolyphosphatase / guanosine-5'-triphosphate,3'-diphosphate pyrophosphatase
MKRYAAIDIGSQTIRLLIADCDDDALYPLERAREIVRLGSGMQAEALLPDRIEHAASCIQRFCDRAREHNAEEILAVATACVRQARNRLDFTSRIRQSSGISPAIISGQREAELSRAGVQAILPVDKGDRVIIDIGGGSTELSYITKGQFTTSLSLPMGVIAPAEQFMHTDPPADAEIEAIRAWAGSLITAYSAQLPLPQSGIRPAIIATAGTATSLAAMDLKLLDYMPSRINGHMLSCRTMKELLHTMLTLPAAQRATLPGLEPGRSAVIIPGTLILLQLLQYFGSTACTVSDSGLLEGIIIQHASLKKIIEKA